MRLAKRFRRQVSYTKHVPALVALVDQDAELEVGTFPFSTVPYHASFFGAFSADPGFNQVVYIKHRNSCSPNNNGGSMAMGMGIGGGRRVVGGAATIRNDFGTHDLEGIYVWNRETGKSTKLWTQAALLKQLSKWVKTPEGLPYKWVSLKEEIRANQATYLFHMHDNHYTWINGSTAFDLDLGTGQAKITFTDSRDDYVQPEPQRAAFAGHLAVDPDLKAIEPWECGLTSAQQNADGSLTLLRPGMMVTIQPDGAVKTFDFKALGTVTTFLGSKAVALQNENGLRVIPMDGKGQALGDEDLHQPWATSLLLPGTGANGCFAYEHNKVHEDTLTRMGLDGKVVWTATRTGPGDPPSALLLENPGLHLSVHIRNLEP